MFPDWLDVDRVEALLAGAAVLAVALALVSLVVARRPAAKVVGVLLFGGLMVASVWQLDRVEEARHTDCAHVTAFGRLVPVPHCPPPHA